LTIGAGIQADDELLERKDNGDTHYTNPFGKINPLKQFAQGRSSQDVLVREGLEIGLLDILYWQRGEVRGGTEWISYQTSGFGISLNGLFRLFDDSTLNHIDIQYHESVIRYEEDVVYSWGHDSYPDRNYQQVTLSWKY
jgi:hypothetical protein